MSNALPPFESAVTVFMLVKTSPEWLGLPVKRRFELLAEQFTPILKKHATNIALRFFDVEFYSARVTDIWMWDARDHHSYQLLVEELRETPFWDRYFHVQEILTGVENAYAKNYDRPTINA